MPADTPGLAPTQPAQVGADRFTIVRQPYAHDSAVKHVTGTALYIDDILEPVGTLHVAVGYAPIAAGRVTAIDLEATKASPGVVTVLTAADIPGKNDVSPKDIGDDPLIASDTVMFYGQVLFAVVADTRDQARRAARKARISTAPSMPVIDVDDALVAETKVLPDYTFERGEPSEEMIRAPRQITGEFRIGGQEHFYLEGQVALAIPGEDGDMFVHSSTQHPTEVQHVVAHVLGIHDNAVTVEIRRMGGGFGGKESQASQWAGLAALAAWKTGHPCKLRLDRDDDMTMTGKRHDFRVDYAAGVSRDGGLRSVDATLSARCGYSEDLSLGVVDRTMFPRRQRLLLPGVQDHDAPHAHQHRVQHRVPRLRRPAGDAVRGAHDGSHCLRHRARPARRAQGQLLRRRRPRPHALRHARRGQHPARAGRRSRDDLELPRTAAGDHRLQRLEPDPEARHRADGR